MVYRMEDTMILRITGSMDPEILGSIHPDIHRDQDLHHYGSDPDHYVMVWIYLGYIGAYLYTIRYHPRHVLPKYGALDYGTKRVPIRSSRSWDPCHQIIGVMHTMIMR